MYISITLVNKIQGTIYINSVLPIYLFNVCYCFLLTAEQVAVLKGHTGLVKGVTWDPLGKYLASQVCFKLNFYYKILINL